MSLIRLLTTGRSLVNIRDGEGRYQETSQRLLPHFGAKRNPFSNSVKAEPTQTVRCASREHTPKVAPTALPAIPASGGERKAASKSGRAGWGAWASSQLRSLIAVLRRWTDALLDGCKARLARLFAHRPSKAAKSAIPRFNKPPVQTELSLDKIKVLRNDLSDVDLEVVPAKAPTVPTTPATPAVEKPAVAENARERATEPVVGARKS
jgi:hypothetical protein